MALWLDTESVEKLGAETRLRDGTASLLSQYADLLRCGEIHGEVEQQVGELRSAVLAAGLVQAADSLLQLEDELRRAAILADHAQTADEVASVISAHNSTAAEGERRLSRVAGEMQAALRELERSYYGCSVRDRSQIDD